MKTVCLNCGTVLTDETSRQEEAYFVSPSDYTEFLPAVSDDKEVTWARCLLCTDVAYQRNNNYDYMLRYNWSYITQENEKSVTVTCHNNDFDYYIKLHMDDVEAKELSQFIRDIMIVKGLIKREEPRT